MRLFSVFLTICGFCLPALLTAQNGIAGKVLNENKEPQEFAAVVLFNLPDSQMIVAEYTDAKGVFEFKRLFKGDYYLKIELLGYQTYESGKLSIESDIQQLGDLVLNPLSADLKEIVVISSKPLIERKADRLVFNVESSPSSAGLNGLELLKRTPSVSVDNNDNIKVKGQGNFTVNINDKSANMSGDQLTAFLKTLRAEDVEAIEVLNAAGAQNDAAGGNAVINIRLKKNTKVGWSGSVNAGYTQGRRSRGNGGGSVGYRGNKISLQLSASNYLGSYLSTGASNSVINQRIVYDSNNEGVFKSVSTYANLNFDWFLTTKHSFGLTLSGSRYQNNNTSTNDTRIGNTSTTVLDSVLSTKSENNSLSNNPSGDINYQYVDTFGHKFFASYYYSYDLDDNKYSNTNQYTNVASNSISSFRGFRFLTPNLRNTQRIKADFEKKSGKERQNMLKAGAKYSNSIIDNEFQAYSRSAVNTAENYDSLLSNNFLYDEKILAIYSEWNGKYKKLTYGAGLRYEYTNIQNKLTTFSSAQPSQSRSFDYQGLFPNVSLGYEVNMNHAFNFSYRRGLSRPYYSQLNTFVKRTSTLDISTGNAYLNPAYSNSYNFGYSLKNMYNFDVNYYTTRNEIQTIQETIYDSLSQQQVFLSVPRNMGGSKAVSLNASLMQMTASWWELFLYGTVCYSEIQYATSDNQLNTLSAWSFNNWTDLTIYLEKKRNWNLNFFGYFDYGSIWGNQKSKLTGSMGFGLGRKFADDKGRLSLNVQNPFFQPLNKNTTVTQNMVSKSQSIWDSRTISLNCSYTFGKRLDSRSRGIHSSEQNRSGGGGNGGGGGMK